LGFAQTHQGPTAAALQFADLKGPQTAPLPRKRLASSAAGGASPLSPSPPFEKGETLLRKRSNQIT